VRNETRRYSFLYVKILLIGFLTKLNKPYGAASAVADMPRGLREGLVRKGVVTPAARGDTVGLDGIRSNRATRRPAKTCLVRPSCAAEGILPKRLGTFAAIGQADPNPWEKRYREDKRTL